MVKHALTQRKWNTMSLSQRHIDTLIGLIDLELKVLDAFPDDHTRSGRIPQLETCKRELSTLAAADRARRKKAFPDLSWDRHLARDKASPPQPAGIPAAPAKPTVASSGGSVFSRKSD